VYELSKELSVRHTDIELHIFGFQRFHDHPGHRLDVPIEVQIFDAHAEENPKAQGFGFPLARAYVERIKPDVCIIFNDFMVLTNVLNEIHKAANRSSFKILAYLDQVYLCQKPEFIENLNKCADGTIAFTPYWRDCIKWQGMSLPCHYLQHGLNPSIYFPIPRNIVRKYYSVSENYFLVLNLNRNQPRKRWDTCLQAFAEVVARRPDAPIKLVIATDIKGAWDLFQLYQRELKKRNVDVNEGMSRIVIPGHPQMLTDQETNFLYNLADIGINTCDGEGFGLCNFEQGGIGIPQIVPRIGGFLDFFDDQTAILVDPVTTLYVDASRDGVGGEAQLTKSIDYADAILKLYDDADLRKKIGSNARARILKDYSWATIADRFNDIIKDTVPKPEVVIPPTVSSSGDTMDISKVMEALGETSVAPSTSEPPTAHAPSKVEITDEIELIKKRLEELIKLSQTVSG
jgi:glycosyltransferase involved in cell wall biosynthesis